jgi:hypothetical protein
LQVLGRHRKAGVKGEVEVGEVKRGEVAVGSETKPTQNLELPAALMVLDSFLCWSANSVTVGAPCLCCLVNLYSFYSSLRTKNHWKTWRSTSSHRKCTLRSANCPRVSLEWCDPFVSRRIFLIQNILILFH